MWGPTRGCARSGPSTASATRTIAMGGPTAGGAMGPSRSIHRGPRIRRNRVATAEAKVRAVAEEMALRPRTRSYVVSWNSFKAAVRRMASAGQKWLTSPQQNARLMRAWRSWSSSCSTPKPWTGGFRTMGATVPALRSWAGDLKCFDVRRGTSGNPRPGCKGHWPQSAPCAKSEKSLIRVVRR